MPRVTAAHYLRTHAQLRRLWSHDSDVFSYISPTEQCYLHTFIKPTKDWSDAELLEYRERITELRPSLPQQAGRALAKLHERSAVVVLERVRGKPKVVAASKRPTQAEPRLSVRALAQPEIDAQKLARAFISLAYQKARHQGVKPGHELAHAEGEDDDG